MATKPKVKWACPYCGETEALYEDDTEIVRFGPITFNEDGTVSDESFEQSEELYDTTEFHSYWCGGCDQDFDKPVQVEVEETEEA